MEALLLILSILAASVPIASTGPSSGKIAPTDATNPAFHHRAYHSTVVVGNYLYIDGGEITTWNGVGDSIQTTNWQNGTKNGNIITLPSNWTYSIDLSNSWKNSTITLNPIQKDSPPLNRGALWPLGDNTFYLYDGATSEAVLDWWYNSPRSNQFWQFNPAGDSGTWSIAATLPSSIFTSLVEVDQAFYASGNDLGFALGGVESDASYYGYSTYYNTWKRLPGLVMYNESSQQWFNTSSKDFSSSGLAINGAAHFVPSFGPEGLLFVLGGNTAQSAGSSDIPISLEAAYMFDPVSKQWQTQKVSGNPPSSLQNQCVVGLEGDDDTYEIFMYGGLVSGSVELTIDLGAVWVLSLPAFRWERQPDPLPFGRWMHSCQVIGNRQMISVGGMVATKDIKTADFVNGNVDPWDQGLGIFDLSDMEWKSSYDASAEPYVTPSIIKDYYKNNERYPTWDNPNLLAKWFERQAKFGDLDSSSTGGSGSTDTGAIVGGVVGSVGGLAIICAMIYFLVRRKKRSRQAAWDQEPAQYSDAKEMDGSNGRFEMAAKTRRAEHAGSPIHELEGRGTYRV